MKLTRMHVVLPVHQALLKALPLNHSSNPRSNPRWQIPVEPGIPSSNKPQDGCAECASCGQGGGPGRSRRLQRNLLPAGGEVRGGRMERRGKGPVPLYLTGEETEAQRNNGTCPWVLAVHGDCNLTGVDLIPGRWMVTCFVPSSSCLWGLFE